MYYSKLTTKGQVTIPAAVRERLHLSAGNEIEFVPYDEYVLIIPINKSVKSLKGILPKPQKPLSCDQISEVIKEKYESRP